MATFVLRTSSPVEGSVEVRNGPLPFFLMAPRKELPLVDGMTVRRGFFDASFEIVVIATSEVDVTIN
jgi:hypothetical protein